MFVVDLYGSDDGEPNFLEVYIKTFEQAKSEIEKRF